MLRSGLRSILCVPLPGRASSTDVLYVDATRPVSAFGPSDLALFEALATHSATAIERARLLGAEVARIRQEKSRLQDENAALRRKLGNDPPIGDSQAMRRALDLARRIAPSDV
ncbi:MAG: hypothetical protein HYV63_12515, partial [Candidatus Schekmanbacteria bacterium]|nr:hypothetical protein [Candidatus Schekmanbacteria bacterium]